MKKMLSLEKLAGKTVGLIACSDGRNHDNKVVQRVIEVLSEMEIKSVLASTIYCRGNTPFSGSPKERAEQSGAGTKISPEQ
ncbi:hypothetical protein KFZ58_12730 [Virgibacillus sp. NKC19-16]|uniref:hypothetical protein n=1 Tax=Virgibacillus salidurans TaxID=2831673 RepID=UPI001F1C3ECE|nr:hypothetical protein [Virgibacillus sp. NKC19-16]UJL45271.1 hypothetical protein KFZ58_12730 [Virgibacillus sp. NKC19-16]